MDRRQFLISATGCLGAAILPNLPTMPRKQTKFDHSLMEWCMRQPKYFIESAYKNRSLIHHSSEVFICSYSLDPEEYPIEYYRDDRWTDNDVGVKIFGLLPADGAAYIDIKYDFDEFVRNKQDIVENCRERIRGQVRRWMDTGIIVDVISKKEKFLPIVMSLYNKGCLIVG